MTLAINAVTPVFAEAETKQSPGILGSIGAAVGDAFVSFSKFFSFSDDDVENEQKSSAELIRKDATVSEELHFKAVGSRDMKSSKPSIDLAEIEDKIAPLPTPEELSKPDDSKDLPIRKSMAQEADLQNMENESTRIEEIDKKISDEMPQAKLANTLSTEEAVNAPTMGALEAEFSSGNPPPVHDGLDK